MMGNGEDGEEVGKEDGVAFSTRLAPDLAPASAGLLLPLHFN